VTVTLDPLDLYLKEIGAIPLLDDAGTRDLARRAQAGDHDARQDLVNANLRLVVNVAKQYSGCGLCLQDLIAEGNVGLIHAVRKFDPERGNAFSTYAVWWIKQAIRKALTNSSKTVRIPAYMRQIISNWRDVALKLEAENGRPPSVAEIVVALDVPPQNVDAVERAIMASDGIGRMVSIDDEDGTDVDHNLRLGFGSGDPTAVDEERMAMLVDRLEPRKRRIVRLRFGLETGVPMTLQDVAGEVGLTRERVRQIEKEAIALLRGWAESQSEFAEYALAG
jgi:RNA polymerase primary sigma factor